jgi:hypothetical protein
MNTTPVKMYDLRIGQTILTTLGPMVITDCDYTALTDKWKTCITVKDDRHILRYMRVDRTQTLQKVVK